MAGLAGLTPQGLSGPGISDTAIAAKQKADKLRLDTLSTYKNLELKNLQMEQMAQEMGVQEAQFAEWQKNSQLREVQNKLQMQQAQKDLAINKSELDYMTANPNWYEESQKLNTDIKKAQITQARAAFQNSMANMTDAQTSKYNKDSEVYGAASYGALMNIQDNPEVANSEYAKVWATVNQRDPNYAKTFAQPRPNMDPAEAQRELTRLSVHSQAFQDAAKQRAIASRLSNQYKKVTTVSSDQVRNVARELSNRDIFKDLDKSQLATVSKLIARRSNAMIDIAKQTGGPGAAITQDQADSTAIKQMEDFIRQKPGIWNEFFSKKEIDVQGWEDETRSLYNNSFDSNGMIYPTQNLGTPEGLPTPTTATTPAGGSSLEDFMSNF